MRADMRARRYGRAGAGGRVWAGGGPPRAGGCDLPSWLWMVSAGKIAVGRVKLEGSSAALSARSQREPRRERSPGLACVGLEASVLGDCSRAAIAAWARTVPVLVDEFLNSPSVGSPRLWKLWIAGISVELFALSESVV
jgi:hypothetical protein